LEIGKKTRVLTIFGTRPEAIKMAPLVKALEKSPFVESLVCVTAQHREMLDQVLHSFEITPDYDLNIMQQRQTLTGVAIRALEGLEGVMEKSKPDLILVHGDTLTTFIGALIAYFHQIPIGHVEAGLRTYDKYFPFPEEMNRQLTGRLADLHFAPTPLAREHLLTERVPDEKIFVTGNTVIDAMAYTIKEEYNFREESLNQLDIGKKLMTVTAHRRENLGTPMLHIANAVRRLVLENEDIEVVWPVHRNPAVQEVVLPRLQDLSRVHLIDPLDPDDMHNLMARSYLILTDSGGIQEEAPALKKPVLVLRDVTERPEAVEAGTVLLVGTDEELIVKEANSLLQDKNRYLQMQQAVNPYGDGQACRRIVEAIEYAFCHRKQAPEPFIVPLTRM